MLRSLKTVAFLFLFVPLARAEFGEFSDCRLSFSNRADSYPISRDLTYSRNGIESLRPRSGDIAYIVRASNLRKALQVSKKNADLGPLNSADYFLFVPAGNGRYWIRNAGRQLLKDRTFSYQGGTSLSSPIAESEFQMLDTSRSISSSLADGINRFLDATILSATTVNTALYTRVTLKNVTKDAGPVPYSELRRRTISFTKLVAGTILKRASEVFVVLESTYSPTIDDGRVLLAELPRLTSRQAVSVSGSRLTQLSVTNDSVYRQFGSRYILQFELFEMQVIGTAQVNTEGVHPSYAVTPEGITVTSPPAGSYQVSDVRIFEPEQRFFVRAGI